MIPVLAIIILPSSSISLLKAPVDLLKVTFDPQASSSLAFPSSQRNRRKCFILLLSIGRVLSRCSDYKCILVVEIMLFSSGCHHWPASHPPTEAAVSDSRRWCYCKIKAVFCRAGACSGMAGCSPCPKQDLVHLCSLVLSTFLPSLPLVILVWGIKKTGKIEYNGLIFVGTKRGLKAQAHSSGYAKFENKTILKQQHSFFLKQCMLNNRLKEICRD